jgi:hypothetical protein
MICIDHRSVNLAQDLPLDVEAGTHELLGNRFNGKLHLVNHFAIK